MPLGEEHIKQAQHNLDFIGTFYESYLYNDWAVTVSFYACVHIIENSIYSGGHLLYQGLPIKILHSDELRAALQKTKLDLKETSPHIIRNLLVEENFGEISDFYLLLYSESRNARYKRYQFDKNDVNLVVKPALSEIVNWSNKKFKTAVLCSSNSS